MASGVLDLTKLGRKSFVTQAALSEVLQAVRRADALPDGISPSALKRARQAAMAATTPYGNMVKSWRLEGSQGEVIAVDYLDPAAMLWHSLQSSQKLQTFFQSVARQNPCDLARPWSICIYSDEVTPGNQLKPHNYRKLQTFYWSIRELGPDALSNEDGWWLLTTVRSSTVGMLKDGLAQVAKHAILAFFQAASDFSTGLLMPLGANDKLVLVAQLGLVIADESALKQMYENKGASGKVPCLLCRNVVLQRYAPTAMDETLTLHTCTDPSRFMLHTKETLFQTVDHLATQSARLNKREMAELEKNCGFNHAPAGPLLSPAVRQHLDPVKCTSFDWMHNYLVGGLFHQEVNLLLEHLQASGLKQEDIHKEFQLYNWPAWLSGKTSLNKIFEKKKGSDADWKSSAGEALGAYPALRHILKEWLVQGQLKQAAAKAVQCFMLLCHCLDLLQESIVPGAVDARELEKAIRDHLQMYNEVHTKKTQIPKGHYSLHLPRQLSEQSMLVPCFVHERRHKELKRFANAQANARMGTERSLLEEMTLTHLEALGRVDLERKVELLKPRAASWELKASFSQHFGITQTQADGLQTSLSASFKRFRCVSARDVVAIVDPPGVAEVYFHCSFAGQLLTCVAFYEETEVTNTFRLKQGDPIFVAPEQIAGPCLWKLSKATGKASGSSSTGTNPDSHSFLQVVPQFSVIQAMQAV